MPDCPIYTVLSIAEIDDEKYSAAPRAHDFVLVFGAGCTRWRLLIRLPVITGNGAQTRQVQEQKVRVGNPFRRYNYCKLPPTNHLTEGDFLHAQAALYLRNVDSAVGFLANGPGPADR